jgi:hypothetical protein
MFGSVCGFSDVRHICNARHQRQGALQSEQIPAVGRMSRCGDAKSMPNDDEFGSFLKTLMSS